MKCCRCEHAFLEQAGYRIADHLDNALRKDAGATPATIAWLLCTLRFPKI